MRKKDDKKKLILKAAIEAFLELGPHKTTLWDIAQRAGMAKTSLYYYFRSKKEIFSTVILEDQKHFLELLGRSLEGKETSESKMCSILESYYHFISKRVKYLTKEALLVDLSRGDASKPMDDYYGPPLHSIIWIILHEGMEKGELEPIDHLDLVSHVIALCIKEGRYLFAFNGNHELIQEKIKQMVLAFFAGMRMKNELCAPSQLTHI